LLAHIRELGLEQHDSLSQLFDLRLKGCHIFARGVLMFLNHFVNPARSDWQALSLREKRGCSVTLVGNYWGGWHGFTTR
jgi:hypothetical protein